MSTRLDRFTEAYKAKNWQMVLQIGKELLAESQFGEPAGVVPFKMAAAAARLDRYETMIYIRIALEVVQPGTLLDAAALGNAVYYRRKFVAPHDALDAGNLYLARYSSYPDEGRRLKARILHNMGSCYELLRNWETSLQHYREAADCALTIGDKALAGMAIVDIAHVEHLRSGPGATERSHALLESVCVADLDPRGLFAYLATKALVLEQQERLEESEETAQAALEQCDKLDEQLGHERAILTFLRARLALARKDEHNAYILANVAYGGFEQVNDRERLLASREFVLSLVYLRFRRG